MNLTQQLVLGNWKSNKTLKEAEKWLDTFGANRFQVPSDVTVGIAPPFPFVLTVSSFFASHHFDTVVTGIQDMSQFPAGKYTGAVSAQNLSELSVRFAILGHSERRKYFHETHQDVANKVDQCLQNGIHPVVCVDDEYIFEQAAAIDAASLVKCVVAYEELSAIGTGDNVEPDKVATVIDTIKTAFGQVPVLYGGSVTPLNAKQYAQITDGVLVGGASLSAEKFIQIAAAFS